MRYTGKDLIVLMILTVLSTLSFSQDTSIPLVYGKNDTTHVVKSEYIEKANRVFTNRENLKNNNFYLRSRVNVLLNTINVNEQKISVQSKQIEKLERIIQINNQSDSLLKKQNENLRRQNSRQKSIIKTERTVFGVVLLTILGISIT